jgi:hypothetical protein
MADASGAVAISSNLFAVASDEDNILRIYQRNHGGLPFREFDMNAFLEIEGKSPEADLEAAARIGDRIFWIGSHGRNQAGKERLNRCRFFATDLEFRNDDIDLNPAGRPYKDLLPALIKDPRFASYDFLRASQLAPKERGALNIEGLAATPEGRLLIGFRNPVLHGKTLVIPLLNPDGVITGQPASFGDAIELDLGGLGIRDMALVDHSYLLVAGASHEGGHFAFYRWPGPGHPPGLLPAKGLHPYHPEALIIYPDTGLTDVQVLSDDGTRVIDGVPNKDLKDPARRSFRSFFLRVD